MATTSLIVAILILELTGLPAEVRGVCPPANLPIPGAPVSLKTEQSLTVCEVLADLSKYRGKNIQVRGRWRGTNLYAADCPPLRTGDYVWEPAIWLEWATDEDAQRAGNKMKEAIAEKPQYVEATFIGRLETREEGLQTGHGGTPDIIVGNGYGEFARFPARLMIAEIEDVRAVKTKGTNHNPPSPR